MGRLSPAGLHLSFAPLTPAQLANVPDWQQQDAGGSPATLRSGVATYLRRIEFVQPVPSTTAAQLTALNPHLPEILPDFARLLATAKVSDRFADLYERKHRNIRQGELLTPHNYFDCETVLRLQHPDSGRRFLLLADRDPFVVLPVPSVNKSAASSPKMGDYAAVIHSDKIYPALLAEIGGVGAGVSLHRWNE